jgi:hypothetical protein
MNADYAYLIVDVTDSPSEIPAFVIGRNEMAWARNFYKQGFPVQKDAEKTVPSAPVMLDSIRQLLQDSEADLTSLLNRYGRRFKAWIRKEDPFASYGFTEEDIVNQIAIDLYCSSSWYPIDRPGVLRYSSLSSALQDCRIRSIGIFGGATFNRDCSISQQMWEYS